MLRPATLPLLFGLCGFAACAYPQRNTHLRPMPAGGLTSFDMPDDLWTLRILDAQLPPRKPTGLPWDEDGSGPDPFVRILIDGELLWESKVIENDNEPSWQVTLPNNVRIPSNLPFRIEVWDDDGGLRGDPLGHIERTGLPAAARPDAEASLVLSNLGTLRMTVTSPRPSHGVGLRVEIHPDAMHVLEVAPDSPAERAGIQVGDRIIEIGPVYVSHMADEDALSRLSLSADRDEQLVVIDPKGTRRVVTLDDKPLWLSM